LEKKREEKSGRKKGVGGKKERDKGAWCLPDHGGRGTVPLSTKIENGTVA